MTHHVYFYPERAFLYFVKSTIEAHHATSFPAEQGAACILATAAALEATVNALFLADARLPHYDELRLGSKIETLASWSESPVDWGKSPWQMVQQLIRVRNWLAHFKDPYMGLTSLTEGWVSDTANSPPRIDPYKELELETIKRYYAAVREALTILATGVNHKELEAKEFSASLDDSMFEVW